MQIFRSPVVRRLEAAAAKQRRNHVPNSPRPARFSPFASSALWIPGALTSHRDTFLPPQELRRRNGFLSRLAASMAFVLGSRQPVRISQKLSDSPGFRPPCFFLSLTELTLNFFLGLCRRDSFDCSIFLAYLGAALILRL